jgi:SP family sugar:H+ symporter-like MFS transporter
LPRLAFGLGAWRDATANAPLSFISLHTGLPIPGANATAAETAAFALPAWQKSLITSVLSAGTFFGAIIAGDLADYFGRRITIICGCIIFTVGCILQVASSTGLGLIVAGRLISGFGVGFISAIIILYMSEIAPRKVRGAIVSGYQFCVTIGESILILWHKARRHTR